MFSPLLITLTGEPELSGKKKPKKLKKIGKIAAWSIAPAIMATRAALKHRKAKQKAQAARTINAQLDSKKTATAKTAQTNPTPETAAAAHTATIQAAAAAANAQAAAREETEAEAEQDQSADQSIESEESAESEESTESAESAETSGDYFEKAFDVAGTIKTENVLEPLFIKESEFLPKKNNFLGFAELTTDEQIAKKIYEATGDLTFKGFLPFSWKTEQIIKMRNQAEILKKAGKLSILNMQIALPSISAAAHDFFIRNADKIKGIIPDNIQLPTLKSLNPLIIAASLAAAAVIIISVKPYLPQRKIKK